MTADEVKMTYSLTDYSEGTLMACLQLLIGSEINNQPFYVTFITKYRFYWFK